MVAAREDIPTLVFLPGFMQRGEAWRPVVERVGERYPSFCLDFDSWTFDERVAELVERSPPGALPVGYSLGGRLALHAAVRHPGAFAGLVLVGSSPGVVEETRRRARRESDESLAAWMEGRPIEDVVARWETMPIFATQSPALMAAQRAGRMSHDPDRLASLLRSAGPGALPPLWDRLADIDVPVLAVAGEADVPYADAARRMAEALPQGDALLVPGAGHAPQLEAPEAVAGLLEAFLDEHFPASTS